MTNKNQTIKKVEGEDQKMNNEQNKTVAGNNENVKAAVAAVEDMNFKGRNECDVKIAETVMNKLTEQENIKLNRKKIELEIEKLMNEVSNTSKERQLEIEHKTKRMDLGLKALSGLGTMAGITAMFITASNNSTDLKIEKLRSGSEQ